MEHLSIEFSDDMAHEIIQGRKHVVRIISDRVFKPGDLLWVKESYIGPYLAPGTEDEFEKNPTKFLCPEYCRYKSQGESNVFSRAGFTTIESGWFPLENMPVWASQTTLRIKDAYRERLQAISDESALNSGVRWTNQGESWGGKPIIKYFMGSGEGRLFDTPIMAFKEHWERTVCNWDANPIVNVLCFEVIRENIRSVI